MKIVTLDLNTKFIAFGYFIDNELIEYGKVFFDGQADSKIGSVAEKIVDKFEGYQIDLVVYESSYLANSPKVAIEISKVIGSLIGGFYILGFRKFIGIPPITWQTGIGVGRTSTKAMVELKARYPDKSITWIKNKDRANRKQLIIDVVNKRYDLTLTYDDNDIADAIAIGIHVIEKLKS